MRVVLFAGLCAVSALAYAEIYKWVDADGKVQYSDQKPPASVNAKALPPPPPPADPDAARRLANQQMELKKAADAEEEKRKKGEQTATMAKQKDEYCSQARGQLQALRSGTASYRYNSKGEPEFIGNEAREQTIRDLEQQIAKNCG